MQHEGDADFLLAQLIDIGYAPAAATLAISATGAADLQLAVQWLLDHPEAGDEDDWRLTERVYAPDAYLDPLGSSVTAEAEMQRSVSQASGAVPSGHQQYDGYPPIPSAAYNPDYPAIDLQQQQQHNDAHQQYSHAQQVRHPQQQRQQHAGSPAPRPAAPSGVAGLIAREQQKAAAADRVLDTALQDLQALMAQAQAMVDLAEQFRLQLARQPPEPGSQEVMAIDLSDDLVDMGIAAPVTKETAGRKYHKELARQLATFLQAPLERAGGMMTLPDVFCLFNRARGTELISPDDLLQAVKSLRKVGAPLELREFADGARVLQSLSHSNEEVCARVAQLVRGEGLGPPLSVSAAAAALRVPLAIAQQHLATAESCGVLCRDDGPEGLRFFRNFFAEVRLAGVA